MNIGNHQTGESVFEPAPENDFEHFYNLYYEQCRRLCPQVEAIAAKWRFEDLIPGLSDFDTRLLVTDSMTVDDWCRMSTAIGEVHLDLCNRYPHWARNLEHLPGINLTWTELMNPASYYPEYPQWTFYRTDNPRQLTAARSYLSDRSWILEDIYFHLKKFCLFYGRYDRTIDPPVNLGRYANKYPLHSRFMHYFCPPLQSALCILLQRPVAGKMETVRLACEMFDEPVFREMQETVESHYEVPELYQEPELSRLEDRLESALEMLRRQLAPEISEVIPNADRKNISQWRQDLQQARVSPSMRIFDSTRFSRLMKGRLRFYANAPGHFDSIWLIENELRRLKHSFFDVPFNTFLKITGDKKFNHPEAAIAALVPSLFTNEEARCALEFARLTSGPWEADKQKEIALAIAAVFDGFFHALNKVAQAVATPETMTRS